MKKTLLALLLANTLLPTEIFAGQSPSKRIDATAQLIKRHVRIIENFPEEGIDYKDISPLLANPMAFRAVIEKLHKQYKDQNIDVVVSIESKGFLFGIALAQELGLPFIMARKSRLPGAVVKAEYDIVYGAHVKNPEKQRLMKKMGVGEALQMLGKQRLPGRVMGTTYERTLGHGHIEIQKGSLKRGQRVLLVNDLLATGVGARATTKLIKRAGAKVAGVAFVIELKELEGRRNLKNMPIYSIVTYE